jgi:hypothetical protein
MTSPQEPATSPMGELKWSQVMPAEAYWRDCISKEIEQFNLDEAKEISSDYYHGAVRTRFICSMIARQGVERSE